MSDGAEFLNRTSMMTKSKSKRRFSDEQIRSLEVMFESETKLEPKKKVELATELGLHPRQVAIWFQNKRARWKSNHVQKEYTILLSDYNTLCFNFQTLNKENQSLLTQLQKLKNEKIGKAVEQDNDDKSDNCTMDYEVRSKYLDEEENNLLKMAAADTSSDDMINQASDGSFQFWS